VDLVGSSSAPPDPLAADRAEGTNREREGMKERGKGEGTEGKKEKGRETMGIFATSCQLRRNRRPCLQLDTVNTSLLIDV